MILIIYLKGEETKSKDGLMNDAIRIKNKIDLKRKYTQEKIVEADPDTTSFTQLKTYLASEEGKTEVKLHIVCHGNSQKIAEMVPRTLAEKLWENGIENNKNLKFIVIHSCLSGYSEKKNYSETPIRLMAQFFLDKKREMYIKGSLGQEVTGCNGYAYVLMDGATWKSKNFTREKDEKDAIFDFLEKAVRHKQRPLFYTLRSAKNSEHLTGNIHLRKAYNTQKIKDARADAYKERKEKLSRIKN